MRSLGCAAAVAAYLFLSIPANALVINYDPGGFVFEYEARWKEVAQSGERVIFDGECDSACTMILGIVPYDRMCVTPKAKFGFHKAALIYRQHNRYWMRPSILGTVYLLSFYPQRIKDWIRLHGGLTTKIKYMPGKESGLQACQ